MKNKFLFYSSQVKKINFYKQFKNKKVLITGHTGFKGSWLTSWLVLLGAKVIGISLKQHKNSKHFESLKLKQLIHDFRFDICDYSKLNKVITTYKPDFVFHLAAQSLVLRSYKEPLKTWKTNVFGTLNLIESLKNLNKNCYTVIVTSDKCYLNIEKKVRYKETDRLGGLDPYSASKASAELVAISEINSFFKDKGKVRIATARAGNVIGGGDWSENRIIPDYIKSILSNKILKIRNPKATRPWQHVLELIYGYLKLATALKYKKNLHRNSFNFGPTQYSNKNVINVINEMGRNSVHGKWKISKSTKTRKLESQLLQLNCSKAKKLLNWSLKLNFRETIKLTAHWYRSYLKNKSKSRAKTFEQIHKYMQLINK